VQVEFSEFTSSQVEAKVLEGGVDFGVCGRTSQQRELDLELIMRDPFVVLAHLNHPLTRRRWVTLPMLNRYPLIVMRRGTNVRSELEAAFEACGIRLQPTYETTHHSSVIGMVEAGLGVGALPSMTVSALRPSRVGTVKVVSPTAVSREIGIVTKHGSASSPAALQLMHSIRQVAASMPVAQR
jgi:DNA-binding transcriptional LysR family regulator